MVITQPLQVRSNVKETIPTLSDFLKIATIHNKSVIFDITEPQDPHHPHKEDFIKLITDAIKTSKFSEGKVVLPLVSLHNTYMNKELITTCVGVVALQGGEVTCDGDLSQNDPGNQDQGNTI